jgi:aryl-alcohol dehydrogenase-like predicted oxidoreductase
MPTRNLGRTGLRVGVFSLGGQAALDIGVNYLDTSSIYGGPERWSERYIGQVMRRRRSEAFLAGETKERTRDNVRLAREFTPLSPTQMAALEARSEPVAKQAPFFRCFDRA